MCMWRARLSPRCGCGWPNATASNCRTAAQRNLPRHTLIRTCPRSSRCISQVWTYCRRSRTSSTSHTLTCKEFTQQNVVYAEMHFDPQAHTSRGIAFDTVITGIRRAQEAAQQQLGIRSQLILGILRDMSAESAMQTLIAVAAVQGLDCGRRAGLG